METIQGDGCTGTENPSVGMSPCMQLAQKGHNNTLQAYSVTVMTHVIAFKRGWMGDPAVFNKIIGAYSSLFVIR